MSDIEFREILATVPGMKAKEMGMARMGTRCTSGKEQAAFSDQLKYYELYKIMPHKRITVSTVKGGSNK